MEGGGWVGGTGCASGRPPSGRGSTTMGWRVLKAWQVNSPIHPTVTVTSVIVSSWITGCLLSVGRWFLFGGEKVRGIAVGLFGRDAGSRGRRRRFGIRAFLPAGALGLGDGCRRGDHLWRG